MASHGPDLDHYRRCLGDDGAAGGWARAAAAAQQRPPADPALADLERALAACPAPADRLALLGQWHHGQGEFAAADVALAEALRRGPATPALLTNHGLVLARLGRFDAAVALQRAAVAQAPALAAAWSNLALALHGAGDAAGAAEAEQRAHALAPDSPEAQVAQGLRLLADGLVGPAQACFRRALQQAPQMPEAWINLGNALSATGDPAAAVTALAQALALAPHDHRAAANLLMARQYDPRGGSASLRAEAARLGAAWAPARPPAPLTTAPRAGRRLRVAYLGGDFRQHPVGWMLWPVLQAHDRSRVEVHAIDTHPATDPRDTLRPLLRAGCDGWHAAAGGDDATLAARLRDLQIDVLVDLAGHTEHGRPGVLAHRAAPVQLAWLGWFASTGVPGVDGVVVGGALADASAQAFHTEPLCRLPRLHLAYRAPDDAPAPAGQPPCLRRPDGTVTFGSFNNTAKLHDEVVACWSQVLQAVPGSRLLLKWKTFADPWFVQHTQHRFARHGIAPDRLDLRPATPHRAMLAEYADVDIALDPFPFPGGLTTMEALWMGVPVVSLPWLRPVSRQGLACLQAVGLDDLAARDVAGYVATAAALAADRPRLAALRQDLRARLAAGPLGDGAGLARALEDLYDRLHDRCSAAATPLPA